ncbi:S1C family serine protease [Peribacillus sp. B-H-3]|uniref:S1C family serine protease n=1 Tax=Peribacillus sp. B-H-3 TaxID=3400420 RepID=UPI003B012855
MGYYDDHDFENRKQRKKGSKLGYFLAGLAGVIIGAILVLSILPSLGVFKNNDDESNVSQDATVQNGKSVNENVNLDVTTSVTKAVDKTGDAVVGIENIQKSSFWDQDNGKSASASGSGVVYKKANGKAYIVTNNHVIEGANELEVTLKDGTKLSAKLRGSDPWTDLAVIEVDGSKVKKVAEFGNSDKLKPGEPVIAIGNPLGLQFSGSITQGIVSGLNRTIDVDINEDGEVDWNAEVIQTDAAINPGNSGGALVNMAGQVVGINSMKIAESAVEGIGLSIPIDAAIPIINDIEKYGEVKRAYMGVNLSSVEEISQYHQQNTLKLPAGVKFGVAITGVQPNSPASKAGLKEFDVIIAMDNKEIKDVVGLRKYLYNEKKIGDSVKITFYRDGKKESATVRLSAETM